MTFGKPLPAILVLCLLLWPDIYSAQKRTFAKPLKATRDAIENPDPDFSLSFLTINLWGLPIRLPGHHQSRRFKQIPERLNAANSDVICVQEAFSKRLRKRILKNIDEQYYIYSNYYCNQRIFGPVLKDCFGGLMTFSKYPIQSEQFFPYPKFPGMRIEEQMGNKGFLLTVIQIRDRQIGVINTHLYAGQSDRDEHFRWMQVKYLDSTINAQKYLTDLPLFLAGDLNIRHPQVAISSNKDFSKVYNFIANSMSFIGQLSVLEEDMYTIDQSVNRYCKSKDGKQKLDYIFYKIPYGLHHERCDKGVVFTRDDSISDHLGWCTNMQIYPLSAPVTRTDSYVSAR